MAEPIDNKAKQPQQKGTGFSNIQDIVRANRQNRLGQAVSGGVSNVVNQNKQGLSNAFDQFKQGAQQNTLGTAADQAFVQQNIANPNASQENIDRFAQLRAGQYQGPTQLGNLDQLQAQGQDLQGLSNAASNEYGRRGLLQRFVAPGQYTQGQQRLDNLLLGQTGGQALNQARRQANLFGQQLGQTEQSAEAQAQGLQQQAQQFGQNVTGQLGQAQTDLQSQLQTRQQEQQSQAEATRAALQALFTKTVAPNTSKGGYSTMPVNPAHPNITQQQFDLAQKALEAGGLANKNFYGAENFIQNPEDVLGQQINAPTIAQVASEQDKARNLALAKLAGQQPTLFQENTQVGGYNPLSFLDQDRLNSAISQGQSKYNTGVTDIKNAGLVQQALNQAAKAEALIAQDAAKYDPNKGSGNQQFGGGYTQQRLAEQQKIYDQANQLLKQSGLPTGGAGSASYYAPPGDRGQWQNYMAPDMLKLLQGTTDVKNKELQKSLTTEGNKLKSTYSEIPLLERLRSLIG